MDDTMLEQRLASIDRGLARVEQILPALATKDEVRNLDRRLARVEQFLPTLATKEELGLGIAPLATKEELRLAIAAAVAPLATKEELRLAIAAAVAPLATKMELAELRREIHEEAKQSRHYMKILDEAHRGDIQLLAEHLVQAMRNPPKE